MGIIPRICPEHEGREMTAARNGNEQGVQVILKKISMNPLKIYDFFMNYKIIIKKGREEVREMGIAKYGVRREKKDDSCEYKVMGSKGR